MHLAPYIETLLEEKHYIILPGFGAFEPGQYLGISINENGDLLPPKRAVSFNPHLSNDDSVLASVIAAKELISVNEVKDKLKTVVFQWKSTLNSKGVLVVEGIGKFEKSNGIIRLVSEPSELKIGSFGLPAVAPPTRKEKIEVKEVEPVKEDVSLEPAKTPSSKKPKTKAEAVQDTVSGEATASSFAYQLAVVLLVLATLSVGYFFYSQLKGVDLSTLL